MRIFLVIIILVILISAPVNAISSVSWSGQLSLTPWGGYMQFPSYAISHATCWLTEDIGIEYGYSKMMVQVAGEPSFPLPIPTVDYETYYYQHLCINRRTYQEGNDKMYFSLGLYRRYAEGAVSKNEFQPLLKLTAERRLWGYLEAFAEIGVPALLSFGFGFDIEL